MADTIATRCFPNTLDDETTLLLTVDELNAQIAKYDLQISEDLSHANESGSIYSGGPGAGLASLWVLQDVKQAEYFLTNEKNQSWADKDGKRGVETHAVAVGGGLATGLFYSIVVLHHIFANHKKNLQSLHGGHGSAKRPSMGQTLQMTSSAHLEKIKDSAVNEHVKELNRQRDSDPMFELKDGGGTAGGAGPQHQNENDGELGGGASTSPLSASPPEKVQRRSSVLSQLRPKSASGGAGGSTGLSKLRGLLKKGSSSGGSTGTLAQQVSGKRVVEYDGESHDNFVMLEGVLLGGVNRFLQVDSSKCKSDEWLYGRAGFLFALLFVRKQFQTKVLFLL